MNYKRCYIDGGYYFFTVNLQDRSCDLLVQHVDLLRDVVRQVKAERPFTIDAFVVLPDHLHAVWTLPANDCDFSGRWRAIKSGFSRKLAKVQTHQQKSVWQNRFWEHCIRDEKDYWHHVNYVHYNPVKHGLVKRAADWPYSSFHRAVKRGIYDENWYWVD